MLIYDPKEKKIGLINDPDKTDFYCGEEFNKVAEVLAQVYYHNVSLQDAYVEMINHINENQIKGVGEQIQNKLDEMLDKGVIEPRPFEVHVDLKLEAVQNSYNKAIEFSLELGADDGHTFLELWNEGCWPEIADEFPEFDLTSAPTGFEE